MKRKREREIAGGIGLTRREGDREKRGVRETSLAASERKERGRWREEGGRGGR